MKTKKKQSEEKRLAMPYCLNGFIALGKLAVLYGKIRGGMLPSNKNLNVHALTVSNLKELHKNLIDDVCKILQTTEKETFAYLSRSYRSVSS